MSKSKGEIRNLQEAKDAAKRRIGLTHPVTELCGKFWFSRMQRKDLDKAGRHRTFAKLFDGTTVEYTQLVDKETLLHDPLDRCHYVDATYLGEGTFSHFEEQ